MSSTLEQKYRTIVWGKMGKHPYWPCFVFDPAVLYKLEPFYDQAQKKREKELMVSFYGDKTMGFVKPTMIRPFNEETIKEMEKSDAKMEYATKKLLKAAIKEAQTDCNLPPFERLQWYFEKYHLNPATGADLNDEPAQEAMEVEKVKEEVKCDYFEESEKESAAAAITGEKRKREDEADEPEAEAEEISSDDISSDEEEEEVSDDDHSESEEVVQKPAVRRSRGRPPKATISTATADATTAISASPAKKQRTAKKTTAAVKKTLKFKKAAPAPPAASEPAAPPTSASAMFENESKDDRLARLTAILQLTSATSTLDEKRALKTLDKIKEIKLSVKDMTTSGIAAVVNNLKSTCQSDTIREACTKLFAKWKAESGLPSSSSSLKATADPDPSASTATKPSAAGKKFAVDRVSKKSTTNAASKQQQEEALPLDLVRKRAVRLLDGVIQNESITKVVENTIANSFGYQQNAPAYYEAVSRTYNALKENEGQRQMMLRNTNAFMANFPGSLFQMVN